MVRIDLNADVGEGLQGPQYSGDRVILSHVTSVSIACGFHAGDPSLMRATVELAVQRGVAIGAHPSYQDRGSFGRLEIRVSPDEIEDLVTYQLGALAAIAARHGARLQHVKPHGALYNMSARDPEIALAIASAVVAFDPGLILMGLAGSESLASAERVGLRSAAEGFADRAYRADGTLVPRSEPGALLEGREAVVEQALRLVTEGHVISITGENVPLKVDSLCVHGDTPDAPALATAIRAALVASNVSVLALGRDY